MKYQWRGFSNVLERLVMSGLNGSAIASDE
jgi:hypothetical protein